ncbi:unnamed protein product [Rotaria sp. Silwood2]|nr:unnamed protein product [Rotaria sp. Silwood2]
MSEEEKRTKKQKIEDNRRLRALSQSLSILSQSSYSPLIIPDDRHSQFSFQTSEEIFDEDSNEYKYFLNDSDRILLTKIEEHYTQAVRLNISVIKGYDNPCLRNLNDFVDVLNEPAHISALRMITLFKLTPEFNVGFYFLLFFFVFDAFSSIHFQSLHEDDRLTLVKHNLIAILVLHFTICTDMTTGIFHEPNTPNDFCYHASEIRNYSDAIYYKTIDFIDELQKLCSHDHLIMKLLILIIIFSKGADYIEPILVESEKVFYAQNVYVDLLWNYLNVRFGCDQTPYIFSRLIFCCMKSHSLARETKETITKKDVQNKKFAPLMQSILQTS